MPLPDLIARYREHGLLFGGGLLAGLLMFLIWLSLQPPRKVEAPPSAGRLGPPTACWAISPRVPVRPPIRP